MYIDCLATAQKNVQTKSNVPSFITKKKENSLLVKEAEFKIVVTFGFSKLHTMCIVFA